MFGNYRPEIIAIATLIMSFIMKLCTHFNITVDASDAVQISAAVAWLVSRALRKYLPDENAQNIEKIKTNLTNIECPSAQTPAETIASTIPPAVIKAAVKDAEKKAGL